MIEQLNEEKHMEICDQTERRQCAVTTQYDDIARRDRFCKQYDDVRKSKYNANDSHFAYHHTTQSIQIPWELLLGQFFDDMYSLIQFWIFWRHEKCLTHDNENNQYIGCPQESQLCIRNYAKTAQNRVFAKWLWIYAQHNGGESAHQQKNNRWNIFHYIFHRRQGTLTKKMKPLGKVTKNTRKRHFTKLVEEIVMRRPDQCQAKSRQKWFEITLLHTINEMDEVNFPSPWTHETQNGFKRTENEFLLG